MFNFSIPCLSFLIEYTKDLFRSLTDDIRIVIFTKKVGAFFETMYSNYKKKTKVVKFKYLYFFSYDLVQPDMRALNVEHFLLCL